MRAIRDLLTRHPLPVFFLVAYGISWAIWLPAAVARDPTVAPSTLLFIGGFGPFLAALLATGASGGPGGTTALLMRLVQWRVGLVWYLVVLYGFPLLGHLGVLLYGAASPALVLSALPRALMALPASAATVFLVLGPLGEELGWRGYALPHLLARHRPLIASAILGVLWAFWHAPLMLIPEWRSGVPLGAYLLLYPLNVVALSVIFTWVYIHTGGSVLLAMLLHGSFNATMFQLNRTFALQRYDALAAMGGLNVLLWLVVVVLVGLFGSGLRSRR